MIRYGKPEGDDPKGMEEGMERAMRLMEALSGVDEALLERCADTGKATAFRRPLWRSTRAIAAVLCLAVVGAASWGGYQLSQRKMGGSDSSGGAESFLEEAEDEEGAMPQDTAAGEAAPENGEAGNAMQAGQGQEQVRQTEGDMPKDEEAAADGQMRQEQEAATEKGAGQDSGGTQEAATQEQVPDEEADSCPLPLQSQKLSLDQAREDGGLGAYVPTALPAGYAFENAYRVTEAPEANLAVCWSRGMDSIMLHLERTGNPPATVDVEKPETYDVRLYEIPYGETVPKEYWQTFDNPVFAAEDFDLEIVKSRMKTYDDRGDTDTPRGNFSVLYEDGTLISFNGRGTAEEIWEMFCSMGGEE